MKFLRNVLAVVIGFFIAIGILFVLFFLFVGIASALGESDTVNVEEGSILKLNLNKMVKDHTPKKDPIQEAFGLGDPTVGLDQLVSSIDHAATDDNIKGISIRDNNMLAGMAQTEAIRDALLRFKESGKFIYSYANYYSQKGYYLNSVADSIFLNPVGTMDFRGLAAEVMYYKDFQEKTGLKMEVIRHGKYKSAVEPYLDNKMSDANREQISELLESVWANLLENIGESRGLSTEALNLIADSLRARTPELALKHKLIDGIIYSDAYQDVFKNTLGLSDDDDLNVVEIEDYIKYAKLNNKPKKVEDKVAIVYAQGEILYGKGNENYIAQGIFREAFHKIAEDEDIKAVVLRVDSPGGNALTSELILHDLEELNKEKPVVVSMGDVAASGGYYIACQADRIIAEPNTITGSIGVFGTIPNAAGLAEKIGINAEQVGTNAQSDAYSFFEPMSPEFRAFVKEGIEETYDIFLDRVAKGRNMTVAEVDSVAQGRVWTGSDAVKIGLVDELGGLDLAMERAAELAEIEEYKTVSYPKYKKDLKEMFEGFGTITLGTSKESIIREEIGDQAYEVLQQWKKFSAQKGIQARLPFEINIH